MISAVKLLRKYNNEFFIVVKTDFKRMRAKSNQKSHLYILFYSIFSMHLCCSPLVCLFLSPTHDKQFLIFNSRQQCLIHSFLIQFEEDTYDDSTVYSSSNHTACTFLIEKNIINRTKIITEAIIRSTLLEIIERYFS